MSSRDDMRHSPDEQRALDALRGLEAPRDPSAPVPGQQRGRSSSWVPLAAAAALAIAIFGIWQFGSGPSALWHVTDVVEADGVSGAPSGGFILESTRIATGPQTELELQLGDQFRFRMLPGSTIELPDPPRRFRPDELIITLDSGEIYGIAEGLDAPVRVVARNSGTQVRGTTFAVFQTPDASCTCLWKGSVEITNRISAETVTLEPGRRFYVHDDGSVSGPQPLDQMETMKLQMMHDGGLLPDPVDQR